MELYNTTNGIYVSLFPVMFGLQVELVLRGEMPVVVLPREKRRSKIPFFRVGCFSEPWCFK